ncbi:MAG TPA: NAD(P)-dependent oxidoreductase [Anaerolineae bacterium]
MRIVVTGSKGDVGRFVVDHVRRQGDDVLGVDLIGRGNLDDYISADLTDAGQVFDVLQGADAVIHLGAISDPHVFPAAHTFLTNTSITYNVLNAAAKLGIRRVVIASSIQIHHPAFPHERIRYRYLPFDEDHTPDPHDEYGLSKWVGEACAAQFAHHWRMTVVSLRITWSVPPERMGIFPIHMPDTLPEPDPYTGIWMPTPFYIDARDCARAAYLAATVDLPDAAHIPLIITARDSTLEITSDELVRRFFPQAERRAELKGFQAICSGARAEQVLGFVPEYTWRNAP